MRHQMVADVAERGITRRREVCVLQVRVLYEEGMTATVGIVSTRET
jgi:hypothetical protein